MLAKDVSYLSDLSARSWRSRSAVIFLMTDVGVKAKGDCDFTPDLLGDPSCNLKGKGVLFI